MARMTRYEREAQQRLNAIQQERASLAAFSTDAIHDLALAQDADEMHRRWSWTLEHLRREQSNAQHTIDVFKTNLEADPVGAFRWGTDAVQAAAKLEVLTAILTVLLDKGPAYTKLWACDKAGQAAKDAFPSSSSAMANLIDAARARAWAEIVTPGYGSPSFIFGRPGW